MAYISAAVFIVAFLFSIIYTFHGIASDVNIEQASKHNQLITSCEKNLPRTETCILIAIPKPVEVKNEESSK